MTEIVKAIGDRVAAIDAIAKARVFGPDGAQRSNVEALPEEQQTLLGAGAIPPPYEPLLLCYVYENSAALQPNIAAYATNVESFGHRLEPTLDLKAVDGDQRIEDALLLERLFDGQCENIEVTPEDVKARRVQVEREARIERLNLEMFFKYCTTDGGSFTDLREKTRVDLETTGNAYWEIIRNADGEITQFAYIPAIMCRLLRSDTAYTEITVSQKVSALAHRPTKVKRRFRSYVQVVNGVEKVFFRDFEDSRVMSSRTGRRFESIDELQSKESAAPPATELLHFRIHSPRSAYGIPRWIGNMLAVLGSRASEEVNYLYFDNKGVPPLAILVSGGTLAKDSVSRIESYVNEHIKGRENFHSVLVLEAESPNNTINGRIRIELKPLAEAQEKDALFQNYKANNDESIGQSFRVPKILRGSTQDINRACYSDDTEVLTDAGWRRHHEVGDAQIAQVDRESGIVRFARPGKLHSFWHEGPMVRLRSSTTDVLVTPDHTMLVREGDSWVVRKAEELTRRRRIVVRASADGFAAPPSPAEFTLPKCCQIERSHDHRPLSFARFVEFVGYFCSDGGTTEAATAERWVMLRQKKAHTAAKMRSCLAEIGWTYSTQTKPDGTDVYLLSNLCLREWLRARCGRGQLDRSLPEDLVRQLDATTARILFDALMAGDGSWDTRARRCSGSYYTASPVLASQVQSIATLLGYRSKLRWSAGGNCWRIALTAKSVARLSDAAEIIPYVGDVHCFETSTGFYVTRRNGCVAYQGNTADASLEFVEKLVFQPERAKFDHVINRVLAAMGIRYWEFVSNSPIVRDPSVLSEMVTKLVTASVLTPGEARELCADIFNRTFPALTDVWTKIPPTLLAAGIKPDEVQTPGEPAPGEQAPVGDTKPTDVAPAAGPVDLASKLEGLRSALQTVDEHKRVDVMDAVARLRDALEPNADSAETPETDEAGHRIYRVPNDIWDTIIGVPKRRRSPAQADA